MGEEGGGVVKGDEIKEGQRNKSKDGKLDREEKILVKFLDKRG